ncbi:hypothetical protein L484_001209 [Morus notabilis]|uniref:Kri1-like C-terminal domain-containing protein n=1 Tax=Morus notabilis TaxID=981085 RepID=W9SRN5_9ROSA|nr:protein KRI1 homolog [Morus notabilis]EXC23014.1 hypothetical protein L484_001209 [Morus notabilis]
MGINLFDGSDSDNEDVSKIEIDKEFARRYEHNKKREDLQRYDELKKRGLIPRRVRGEEDDKGDENSEESSSSDDDDGDVSVHSKKDLEFFEALIKIRKQDPSLKSKDVKLFDSESDSDDDGGNNAEEEKKKKKKKAMYLKDVVAKHLIEEGPELCDKNEKRNRKNLAYNEEQEEIRKAFLEAVEENEEEEDGDDLLRMKEKDESDEEESDEELHKKLDEYFGGSRSGEPDENADFLKEYFMNKMWIDKHDDKGARGIGVGDEELEMLSEDEKEIEKQEEYEYRFQENSGDQILGHSREVEGTVRKKVKARKEQRKHKEERMEIARLEREEELRHLKNLKKKEMDERVKKIMESAGIQEDEIVPLSAKELEEEFDPEEYDRMMKKAFGDKYYDAEDADPEYGSDADEDGEIEKPDFEKEDELLGLPKGWASGESGDGFLAARERILKHKMETDGDHKGGEEDEEEDEEEEERKEVSEEGKRKSKRKLAILEKAKQAMLEEYYKLDYEDAIGDLKTRFKYAKLKPNRYGLSTAEILVMDDNDLNQYVSLKKIAPYQDEWKVPNSKRYEMKMKAKEVLRQGKLSEHKIGKKKRKRDDANKATSSDAANGDEKPELEESAGVASNLSRKARRKQRQAELKISNSRLKAYGKIESKPKKAKH